MMAIIAGRPEPSDRQYRINGAGDKIHGYDDGEWKKEYRSYDDEPQTVRELTYEELEILAELE